MWDIEQNNYTYDCISSLYRNQTFFSLLSKCSNLHFITQDLIQQVVMFQLLHHKVISNKILLLPVTCLYLMLSHVRI